MIVWNRDYYSKMSATNAYRDRLLRGHEYRSNNLAERRSPAPGSIVTPSHSRWVRLPIPNGRLQTTSATEVVLAEKNIGSKSIHLVFPGEELKLAHHRAQAPASESPSPVGHSILPSRLFCGF